MEFILSMHKTRKYIILNIVFFIAFLVIYYMLDVNANESYQVMLKDFGMLSLSLHLLLNILISFISSVIMIWSMISLQVNKKDVRGSNIPFIGVLIGFFTFGCTPCVVAFLSIFGITFTPIILPAGNLLWKVIVLLIVIIAGMVTYRNVGKACKI